MNHLSFPKQRKGSGFLNIFSHQKLVVQKFIKSNANVLEEKSKENKVMHAASELGKMSMCTCSAAQVFVVSVTQKSLEYFVMTLIIDQLQA